jgi:hypothetical protein
VSAGVSLSSWKLHPFEKLHPILVCVTMELYLLLRIDACLFAYMFRCLSPSEACLALSLLHGLDVLQFYIRLDGIYV